jgi:preprotein translocase subunit YajC
VTNFADSYHAAFNSPHSKALSRVIPAIALAVNHYVLLLVGPILAQQPAAAAPEDAPGLMSFLPLILGIVCIYYLTMVVPERKKKVEEASLMRALKKNDRVITIGGIHGIVASIGEADEPITLKIDEGGNTRIKVNRSAIAKIVEPKNDENAKKESAE